ncbi:GNAT family N-acetyltransferase [Siphonobacter sp. SORGH_AS_0500]|uniref:GNAT family N-acetyltransferase n=1 Tax=Siphonobacter sp. SORGH_AS_0500 TaxID=1864824 RepID=UPI00285D98CC|nr:GNAT family N-acetyltransferase [Siphonobacter sp. SORGH_AS_0500]MDR6195049.1 GNAT superfamily N-acetyltransferase [Siphonobacter sp. SORGH_AS_0500]
MKVENCILEDYFSIVEDIVEFWGSNRTLKYHHPIYIHEFGQTAFVIRDGGKPIAYLFGFISDQSAGYVHLVGIRESYQKKGLGSLLYQHFIAYLKAKGYHKLKAITTPQNEKSIAFHHHKMGMEMIGELGKYTVPVVTDYAGKGEDRVVFIKDI